MSVEQRAGQTAPQPSAKGASSRERSSCLIAETKPQQVRDAALGG
jgi:hypothetical protein